MTSLYWTLDLGKADILGRLDVNGNMGFALISIKMPETDFLNANISSTENLSGKLKLMEDGNHYSVATGKDGEWSQRI